MVHLPQRTKIRRAFIAVSILGIIINFGFDILAYMGNRNSDESGLAVAASYGRMFEVQRLDRAVEQVILNPSNSEAKSRLKTALASLRASGVGPIGEDFLRQISQAVQNGTPRAALSPLRELTRRESSILKGRMERDRRENQDVERSLFRALILDGFLIAMLFSFFLIEIRSRRKIEENLLLSLNNLRETNIVLREEELKRQLSMQLTVHDLRSPLGSIRGFAELIADGGSSPSTVQEFSEIIRRITENSLNLVDRLLTTGAEEPLKAQPLDLNSVLADVCLQLDVQAAAKDQTIIRAFSEQPLNVKGDRVKLEELVANLVSNAIKYSPRAGKILVRSTSAGDSARVEVEDQGAGFTLEDKQRAFQFGQRLSAKPTGDERSTGIGLFVARQIVERHSGRIQILDTGADRGACVVFEIPRLAGSKKAENVVNLRPLT